MKAGTSLILEVNEKKKTMESIIICAGTHISITIFMYLRDFNIPIRNHPNTVALFSGWFVINSR